MHVHFSSESEALAEVSFEDFLKIDMRIGEIVALEEFPKAHNPSFKIKVDFGGKIGIKNSSAQITHHYSLEQLLGKRVVAVVNLKPRQIGAYMSEVLIMGFADDKGEIVLFDLDKLVPKGARLL
jgi:tRNA-binding protein